MSAPPDEFGAPAPRGDVEQTDDGLAIRRGQYVLPHPHDGSELVCTRASTLAKTLDDGYMLNRWKQRRAIRGVALRPDLVALVASVSDQDSPEGKATLNDVAKRAIDIAGAHAKRDTGTALHEFAKRYDNDEPGLAHVVPEHLAPDLAAYQRLLREHNLTVIPQLSERVVCAPHWRVAGRLDRVVSTASGTLVVTDLKSGSTLDYSGLEFATQMFTYVTGLITSGVWDKVERRWMPVPPEFLQRIATTFAYILHIPSGTGTAQLYAVDLREGTRYVEAALEARELRRIGKKLIMPIEGPLPAKVMLEQVDIAAAPVVPRAMLEPAPTDLNALVQQTHLNQAHDQLAIPGPTPGAAEASLAGAQAHIREQIAVAATIDRLGEIWERGNAAGWWSPELDNLARERADAINGASGDQSIPTTPRSALVDLEMGTHQEHLDQIRAATPPVQPDDYTLARTAATQQDLANLWSNLFPHGRWTESVQLAANTRMNEIMRGEPPSGNGRTVTIPLDDLPF